MTQPAKAQEPSMEEILASIRRIIADDDPKSPPAPDSPPPRPISAVPPAPPPPEPAGQQEMPSGEGVSAQPVAEQPALDVLDLTEAMAAPATGFRTINGESDVMFEDDPVENPPRARHPEPAPPPPEPPRRQTAVNESALVSSITSAAVDSAFNTLAHTVLAQNARTLEDLVREMLRPLLKTWLDDNLPGLVERLVRLEIERVSRGRS
jgi:cell pole-organizing protein PopZ